ncbi:MALTOSE EXCESS PROTEIN 1 CHLOROPLASTIC-RELATED [Salix purpurea]|uniref:MALTOSE EXCESS PROTEIN 1 CHLOROPLASTIC-RELATED n=1 Tax=Salix purpurea TaxID=77065 RepID=A0A9Q0V996_SALPP|nr:MALTOSE EXCESS PROTEIN 1 CHLOROPLASTIC-RELATED [Salix purpurea]
MASSLIPAAAHKSPPSPCLSFSLYPNLLPRHSLSFPSKPLLHRHSSLASLPRRLSPVPALESDVPHHPPEHGSTVKNSKEFEEWDFWTAKFSGGASVPFLLLQMPQIILNANNLMSGNKTALLAVPWLGMLTGLLGNLSLLSYFAKKRETEAIVVQTLGVVSIYIVIAQLAMAEAMPLPYFMVTSLVVATGLVLNFLNYFEMLNDEVWCFWEDFITVGGLSALPQVMWSTFVPFIPNTILPGAIAFVAAVAAVIMARTGKLSEKGLKFVGAISGWTATLLFMWMPVSQMWTNFLNPDNIKGLSAFSMLLAMIGNGLLIPRALFVRDFMWFTGSTWAALFYGYGNILCMYYFNSISGKFLLAATAGLISWIGMALWRDTVVYGHSSPLRSLKELVFVS